MGGGDGGWVEGMVGGRVEGMVCMAVAETGSVIAKSHA